METAVKTDNRLLAIINGGTTLRSIIDPEGISQSSVCDRIVLDITNHRWKMHLLFTSGESLWLQGTRDESEELWIEKLKMPAYGKLGQEPIPCKRARTLLEGLGDLGNLPARLRKLLDSPSGERRATEQLSKSFLDKYVRLIDEALIWEIELQDEKHPMARFAVRKISFVFGQNKHAIRAEFCSVCDLPEGRIIVSADADVYGLGKKHVILEKNLGMSRNAIIECRKRHDERHQPSLRAAFDLYETIPILYGDQRTIHKDTGKPKAQRKDEKAKFCPKRTDIMEKSKKNLQEEYRQRNNRRPQKKHK